MGCGRYGQQRLFLCCSRLRTRPSGCHLQRPLPDLARIPQAVTFSGRSLTSLASLKAKGADNLRVTLTLPSKADNNYQGLTSAISLQFDAVQRAATNQ